MFEDFFEQVRVGLALADLTTRYVRVNDEYARLVGRAPEDLIGTPFHDLLGRDGAQSWLDAAGGPVAPLRATERYERPDGATVHVLHTVALVRTRDGRPGWYAVSAQDISDRVRGEQELRELSSELARQALRDPLTDVANRTLLEERMRGALARDARSGGATGVLFLDLDGFKAVNDSHGHEVGDQVLRTVARRLSACVRPSDTVARLGGDEFVVLVEGASPEGLAALCDRLTGAVLEPVRLGRLTLEVGVSVGQALCTAGELAPADLLRRADAAMYQVKQADRPGSQTA